MKSSNNHKGLVAGDYFEKGLGPKIRIHVVSIDALNQTATIRLCYSLTPVGQKSVKILYGSGILLTPCFPKVPVEGEISTFSFSLTNVFCHLSYQVYWGVQGASPVSGQVSSANTFSIITPDPSVSVVVFITVVFEDGDSITGYYPFTPLPVANALWGELLCNLSQDRLIPHPWWEWDPEKLRHIAGNFSEREWHLIERRTELILNTIRKTAKNR